MTASLARRTAWLAVGQTVVRGGPLAAVLVLVRSLPGAAWDQLALLLSIYLAAQSLGTLNLQHGIIFFAARVPRSELRGLVAQTAALVLATGALAAALVLIAIPLVSGAQVDVGRWLPIVALAILVESPCACAPLALLAVERATAAAVWEGGFAALQLIAICAPVVFGAGVDGAIGGLVVSALVRVAAFALVMAVALPASSASPRRFREIATFALPLGLALGASALNQGVDKWLVAALDPGAFGSYAVVAQELPIATVVPYAMAAALATRITAAFQRRDQERAHAYWMVQTSAMTLYVVPIVAATIVCAGELIALAYAPGPLIVIPFQIFAVIGLHRVAEYGLVLRAADRGRTLLAASALLLAANLALSAPLTLVLGAPGTALGTLGANAIAWLFVLWRIADAMNATLRTVFPWRLYARALGVAGAAAAVTLAAVAPLGLGTGPRLAAKAALYVTAWLVGARLLRLRALVPAMPAS